MRFPSALRNPFFLAVIIGGSLASGRLLADALIVTRAMTASTIVEIFVEDSQLRVEFEVGAEDALAFKNVLPDEVFETLTGRILPLEDRVQRFLENDWAFRADGRKLTGSVKHITPAKRIVRDEITGEPVSIQPDDAESVIRIELRYPLEGKPTTLSIRQGVDTTSDAPTASIGFVCYHKGLPVNDFRYLPGEIVLDLDWDDPWYSRFRHPNLRRQFDAPLSVYLYIEPYEVRKEIVARPKDLQSWIDLGIAENDTIPVESQAELKDRVADFLSAKNPLTIDGKTVEGRLDRIHFVHRTLRTTGIVEPPIELDTDSATLGVIFVYPIDELPEEVSMTWELFSPKIQSIPAVASDEAGGLPWQITPDDVALLWRNYLINPTIPQMVTIAEPPGPREVVIPVISLVCSAVLIVMLPRLARSRTSNGGLSRMAVGSSLAIFVCGILSFPFARAVVAVPFASPPKLSHADAEQLMGGLLYNVYRAFDHHDESLIYDRLSQSIAGELLSDVYLETRKSMEVKNQGGLRISVKDVSVIELGPTSSNKKSEFSFQCRWQVSGSIGHWGHIHRRVNEHLAHLTLAPLNGRWKITAIEMLDQQQIEFPQRVDSSNEEVDP